VLDAFSFLELSILGFMLYSRCVEAMAIFHYLTDVFEGHPSSHVQLFNPMMVILPFFGHVGLLLGMQLADNKDGVDIP
jgi:hypothetical protein